MSDYNETLQEIMQRTRRIETRLVRLCLHTGLDPTDGKRMEQTNADPPIVAVHGLDASFSDCLQFCRTSGISGIVTLTCRGELLGSILVKEKAQS